MSIAKSTQAGLESKFKTCNSKIAERKHLDNHFPLPWEISGTKKQSWANGQTKSHAQKREE